MCAFTLERRLRSVPAAHGRPLVLARPSQPSAHACTVTADSVLCCASLRSRASCSALASSGCFQVPRSTSERTRASHASAAAFVVYVVGALIHGPRLGGFTRGSR